MKIVRPLRFDNVRREARNKKRRESRRRREEQRQRFARFFNRLFWIGIEPEIMWDDTDFDGEGRNDNISQ